MPTKLWTKDFLILNLLNFLIHISFIMLMFISASYAISRFGAAPSEGGFASGIFVIGALFMRIFTGRWIADIGYKKTLCTGLIIFFIMHLFYFIGNSITALLFIRLFQGAAFGIASSATNTIVSAVIPKERSGEAIGYYSLSMTLGTAVGPFLGMFLSRYFGFEMIFNVCTAVAAASLLISLFLSLETIKSIKPHRDKAVSFFGNYIEFKAIPLALVGFLAFACYACIVSFLAVYAKEIQLLDAAGFFFFVYAMVSSLSRPLVGRLFDRKGANTILYPAFFALIIGLLLFSQSYNGVMILSAAALIGYGFGTVHSTSQAIITKTTLPARMGMATSTYFICADIGMGVGPFVAGFLIPLTGYRGMYAAVAIFAFVSMLFYYFLHGRVVTGVKQGIERQGDFS